MKHAEVVARIRECILAELAGAGRVAPSELVGRVTDVVRCPQKLVEKTLRAMELEPHPTTATEATETANEPEYDMAKKKPIEEPKAKPTPKPKKGAPPEPPPLFDDVPPTDEEIAEAEKRDAEAAAKRAPVAKAEPRPKDDEPTEAEIEKAKISEPVRGYVLLPHTFTRDEIDGLQKARLDIDVTIEDLTIEWEAAKEKASELKRTIEQRQADGMAISKRIRGGAEERQIPCEDRKEYDVRDGSPTKGKLMIVTYRLDTKEPIKWREPVGSERQRDLFDDDKPVPTPPEKKKRGAKKAQQEAAEA